MRRFAVPGLGLMVVLLGASTIFAANVHFKSGPTFRDNGTTLTASGALAGLGNQDVTIRLTATGNAAVECRNPAGHVVPGQNKPRVTLLGTQSIPSTKVKNGNVSFSVTTAQPAPVTPKAAGCPNNNWSTRIVDVVFTSATLTVVQGGQTVLNRSFTL